MTNLHAPVSDEQGPWLFRGPRSVIFEGGSCVRIKLMSRSVCERTRLKLPPHTETLSRRVKKKNTFIIQTNQYQQMCS